MLRFLKTALVLELCAIVWLSILMSQFFYRAYITSSTEHLPMAFLAALVMLVLGTQQTAMSLRREKARAASGQSTTQLRRQVAYSTLFALLFVAASVLAIILRHHLG